MAWNGSGTFARLYNWVSRAANPATKYIDPTSMDAEFDNYKTGLENCLTKTGETTPTANQPMGTFRHTGVGAAVALTDYARAGEVQKGTIFKAASPGGTIDAMTGTLAPVPSLTAGQIVSIIAPGSGSNTITNPTITLNGGSAVTIKKHQGALVVGDYTAGDSLLLLYDGTYFELLNPKYASVVPPHSSFTTDATGGATDDLLPFIDASDSNADNKVTVSDFFTNILANFTAKTVPVLADTTMIADSAASGAPKISTWQQIFNMFSTLTAKTVPILADSAPIVDSAASNVSKLSTWQQIFNMFGTLTAKGTPVGADKLVIADSAASDVAKHATLTNIATAIIGLLLPTQANMEAASSNALAVTPGRLLYHPSSTKASIQWDNTGTLTNNWDWAVSGVSDTGTGRVQITFDTAFSTAFYPCNVTGQRSATNSFFWGTITQGVTPSTTVIDVATVIDGAALGDTSYGCAIFTGDL